MKAGSSSFAALGTHLARKSLLWWSAVLVWAVVLWLLSANPSLHSGPSFPLKDKILHCLYFCGGASFLLLALYGQASAVPTWRVLLLRSFLFTAITGAVDEFHQTFTPGRSGNDPWDWLADVTGGMLAAWIILKLLLRLRRTDPTGV